MKSFITLFVLILGIVSIYFETFSSLKYALIFGEIIDLLIITLSAIEFIFSLSKAKYKRVYLSRNLIPTIMLFIYFLLFLTDRIFILIGYQPVFSGFSAIIVLRNFLIFFQLFSRFQKLSDFVHAMAVNPAQTIALSFLLVIFAGTIFLKMPFALAPGKSITVIDSLFTATSAVCVTGLVVADTATNFSFYGKVIIMLLIQIGGLGIMILSFSSIFMFKKSVSLENKMLISYMINENDMTKIHSIVKKIVAITFYVEAAGALILLASFDKTLNLNDRIFYSIFHAVSAFCNAGFSLFTNNLEHLASNYGVVLTIGFLIILGGISFSAMMDLGNTFFNSIKSFITGKYKKNAISTNSKVVFTYTFFLILTGMLFIYFFEHGNSMKNQPLPVQYLSAFFQSVTLRTAGFNSISFSSLLPSTIFLMVILMFIGGASGGTAGGIKVNSLAVIISYLRSLLRKEKSIILYSREITHEIVLKAFSVLSFGLIFVTGGFFLLLIFEHQEPLSLLFETTSAFGTVGLSVGITSNLSSVGKLILIILMFAGRVGPLTLVASVGTFREKKQFYKYPEADIAIG